jgi:lipoprotein-releasing system ATP-binding protein
MTTAVVDGVGAPVLEAADLTKVYVGGDHGMLTILDGVNLQVHRGEMVAIVGASGAGKSTLLQLLGALDRPTSGHVIVSGQLITAPPPPAEERTPSVWSRVTLARGRRERARERESMRDDERISALRNRAIGFVFQFHHLLREFSALENVAMPLRVGGWEREQALARAAELLERVGLGARMSHRPAQLSGGEQQRAAVARALAVDPAVLLADEPSGNLDHSNSERLHDLLVALARDFEIAMVVVTHNRSLASRADRVLLLEDGRLSDTDVREVVT